ncbi:hypothetical protein MRX96_010955 [Rhipicephalus microplus]
MQKGAPFWVLLCAFARFKWVLDPTVDQSLPFRNSSGEISSPFTCTFMVDGVSTDSSVRKLRHLRRRAPSKVCTDDTLQNTGGWSSGTSSQLCTAPSSKRTSSDSEFTAAPSSVSLPTVPLGVKQQLWREPARSRSESTDAESTVDLRSRP